MQVNDLIFKELLKRGYSLEGKTRVWNIADSKLWYLTPEQAQAFLNLEDQKQYRKDITQKETDLITENITSILHSIKDTSVNIIDVGCGDGRKAELFIKALKGKVKLRYCPIDISDYMVQKALDRLSRINAGEVIKFQWNISDFENLENVSALLRRDGYKRNLFLLLGNTLGNFEINELLYSLRNAMKEGDFLLIGNGLDNTHPEEILKSYNNESFNKFSIRPILELGLSEKEVEFGVRFVNGRVESYYTLKVDKRISFLGRTVDFKKGDQIIVIVSYKYDESDFKSFMKIYFDENKIFVSQDQSYALALCKK